MTWVVDASVAAKWLVPEEDSDLAERLIGDDLIAPELMVVEVAGIGWKKWRRRELDRDTAIALADAVGSFVTLLPTAALVPAAIGIAYELDHPVYDCLYLALSVETGARLVTADRRLAAACRGTRLEAHAVALGDLR